MRPVLAVLALPLLIAGLPAQDEAKAIKQFKKPFRTPLSATEKKDKKSKATPYVPPPRPARGGGTGGRPGRRGSQPRRENPQWVRDQLKVVQARVRAIQLLDGMGSVNVAKALVGAFHRVDNEVRAIDGERARLDTEFKKIDTQLRKFRKAIKEGKASSRNNALFNLSQRSRQIYTRVGDLRTVLDGARSLLFDLNARIEKLRDLDTLAWLLQNVTANKKYSIRLKLTVARAVGGGGEPMVADMAAALAKTKRTDELIALLDGIGLVGKPAKAAAPAIIQLLRHDSESVAERAALALSNIAVPEAIEPMITLLAIVEGQSRRRVAAYLEALTRQKFGDNVSTWRNWYKSEGADYLAGKHELGGGEPSSHQKLKERNYYFGIPQDGKSIVYIIDSSGSMRAKVDAALVRRARAGTGTSAGPAKGDKDGREHESTRLEACKAELIRALGLLSPDVDINVIWFSQAAHIWQPGMVKASPKNVKEAQDWVRKLTPNGSTNIHDSLQLAFNIKGIGKKGRRSRRKPKNKYDVPMAFDTIFLLTDGSPTKPPGNIPDSTEDILEGVRMWNPLKRVTIHCIGVGRGVRRDFMEQLASENGGQFKQFVD